MPLDVEVSIDSWNPLDGLQPLNAVDPLNLDATNPGRIRSWWTIYPSPAFCQISTRRFAARRATMEEEKTEELLAGGGEKKSPSWWCQDHVGGASWKTPPSMLQTASLAGLEVE